MKTLFSKVPGLGLFKHDKRHSHAIHRSSTQADELARAFQDMQDMRDRYDSFLSAAASTTNTAFEFSESLQEMGDCLLKKTALTDDDENGKVLLMLGKTQFNIQKLLDNYRSHIYKTITAPSQSLVNELQIVEDMKRQCDEKRSIYEGLKKQHENGRSNKSKEVHVSSRQLQLARDQFDECATLFIFRMKSLKKGQSRSLLTQAARHYAAQMCLFRKALESLEAIEPHIKSTTEEQHIDYCFSGLEDDDDDKDSSFFTDNEDEDEDNMNYSRKNEVPFSENTKLVYVNTGSKSAPISMEDSFDNNEKHQEMRRSSTTTGKLNTYVLPTPVESQRSQPRPASNIWRSMPLEHKKYEKKPKLSISGPIGSTAVSSLPKIRELHELPKPPGIKKPSKLGFSEPLMTFNRGPGFDDLNKVSLFDATYRLREPSRSERDAVLASKQKEMLRTDNGMVSPPLSPISFKNNLQGSTAT